MFSLLPMLNTGIILGFMVPFAYGKAVDTNVTQPRPKIVKKFKLLKMQKVRPRHNPPIRKVRAVRSYSKPVPISRRERSSTIKNLRLERSSAGIKLKLEIENINGMKPVEGRVVAVAGYRNDDGEKVFRAYPGGRYLRNYRQLNRYMGSGVPFKAKNFVSKSVILSGSKAPPESLRVFVKESNGRSYEKVVKL